MSDWEVCKRADTLRPGERFVYQDFLGGQGEILTVESSYTSYGMTVISAEEIDFELELIDNWMVRMAPGEEEP